LFLAVVRALVTAASDPVHAATRSLEMTGDLESDLVVLARRQLELVLQPQLMQLRRLVIAEADRFPQLGRAFYELGPARTIDALADALAAFAATGRLRLPDARVAASQLNWLIMGEPLNQSMLLGFDAPPPPEDLDRWARTAVTTFLAAYARGPAAQRLS
jgi:TetR/AcrR family transcriptional repressor of mexJK operon